jgi:hypothetical protein
MSHIKVDLITSRSGTNVNLGTSGQTITIPSGVTLTNNGSASGFGQTWDSNVKSSNFTAVSNVGYFVDTSGGTLTLTLPASPSLGDAVSFVDYAGTFDTAGMAIDPNGNKINGDTNGTGVVIEYQAGTFTYSDATRGWIVTNTGTPGFFSSATITFDTASGNIGTILDSQRDNAYTLSPVTASASFGGLTYSIQSGSLPSGMTLNSSTGALSGNVAQEGGPAVNYDFTVRATSTIDAGTFSDRVFQITVDPPPGFITATGGTISTCGDYKTHIFTGPSTFTVTDTGNEAGSNTLEYLVVAGGGGGGGRHGAGAGAGGFRTYTTVACSSPLSAPSGITATVTGYPISVGGGGGGGGTTGSTGNGSSALGISSAGGGYGGGGDCLGGGPGGSGGAGTTRFPSPNGAGNQPPVAPPQGNPGSPGARGGGGAGNYSGGGSGGTGSYFAPGFFGPLAPSYGEESGGNRYFSGGGGGEGSSGGLGGGGNGATPGGTPGDTNTGGAGGGGGYTGGNQPGGSGGSGIVVIRYKFQ